MVTVAIGSMLQDQAVFAGNNFQSMLLSSSAETQRSMVKTLNRLQLGAGRTVSLEYRLGMVVHALPPVLCSHSVSVKSLVLM